MEDRKFNECITLHVTVIPLRFQSKYFITHKKSQLKLVKKRNDMLITFHVIIIILLIKENIG